LPFKIVFLHHNKQNRAGACSDLQVFTGNRGIAVTSTTLKKMKTGSDFF